MTIKTRKYNTWFLIYSMGPLACGLHARKVCCTLPNTSGRSVERTFCWWATRYVCFPLLLKCMWCVNMCFVCIRALNLCMSLGLICLCAYVCICGRERLYTYVSMHVFIFSPRTSSPMAFSFHWERWVVTKNYCPYTSITHARIHSICMIYIRNYLIHTQGYIPIKRTYMQANHTHKHVLVYTIRSCISGTAHVHCKLYKFSRNICFRNAKITRVSKHAHNLYLQINRTKYNFIQIERTKYNLYTT